MILSSDERLRSKKDFATLKTDGKRVSGKNLIYVTCKNNLNLARFGCIVTRKTGNAVVRNRWKRLLREFFRLNKPLFASSFDHLWIVKSSTLGKPNFKIQEEMKHLLTQRPYENRFR